MKTSHRFKIYLSAFLLAFPLLHGTNVMRRDLNGWTILTPSIDSRVIYVSSSSGDDSNDGLSVGAPKKTLSNAVGKLRDGYPDQLRLKRGDRWAGETLQSVRLLSGRSFDERLVVGAYGDGPRPILDVRSEAYDLDGSTTSNLVFVGIDFYAGVRDPSSVDWPGIDALSNFNGLRLVGSGENILIEDCRFRFFGDAIIVEGFGSGDPRFRNFSIRRSIVQHSWLPGSYSDPENKVTISNGMYVTGTDGILIEECLFDQNGYLDSVPNAGPNMFNHNIYLQYTNSGTLVRGNFITRASAHGIQMRSLGLCEDTFFAQNAVNVNFTGVSPPTHEFTDAIGRYNVIEEGTLMDPANSDWPRSSAVWAMHIEFDRHAIWTRNIIANRTDNGVNSAFHIAATASADLIDNIVYEWDSSYDTVNPNWIDPERSAGSYYASLGGVPSLDAFIGTAAERGALEWDEAYTAYAVNAYIRDGFRETGADYLEAYPSSRSAHNSGGQYVFSVQSNVTWSVSKTEDWLDIDTTHATGDGTIIVTAAENTGTAPRAASVILTSAGLTRELFIYQQSDQNTPYINLDSTSQVFPGWQSSREIAVSSNSDWYIESASSWVQFSPASGSNSQTVSINAEENVSGSSRRGTVWIRSNDGTSNVQLRISQGSGTTWNDYSVTNDWAYVGSNFLQWVYIRHEPWLYSYALKSWCYLPENALNGSERGTWVYLMDLSGMGEYSRALWFYSPSLSTWMWLQHADTSKSWAYILDLTP